MLKASNLGKILRKLKNPVICTLPTGYFVRLKYRCLQGVASLTVQNEQEFNFLFSSNFHQFFSYLLLVAMSSFWSSRWVNCLPMKALDPLSPPGGGGGEVGTKNLGMYMLPGLSKKESPELIFWLKTGFSGTNFCFNFCLRS